MAVRRHIVLAGLASALLAVAAAPAAAAEPSGAAVSPAVLGIDFPSVKSIVEDVVKFFFGAFLDALVPDWLKDGSVDLLKRLVTVPNPTDARVWPTLAKLTEGMRWIAIPLLSLAAVAAWTQHWINELTGRPASFETALTRTALAAVLLVSYAFWLGDAVALINTVTNAMLSMSAVEQGLERTVGLVFAGTLLSGSGLLAALLGIAAVVLGVGLFLLSVGLLILFGILYVSAPLAIVCSVVDETHGVWTAWRYTLLTAALVPIGWCVLFATAGAFMRDVTTWSGGIAGELGARLTGVFAALIILYLAVRWPLMLWGAIRMQIAGAMMTVGARRGLVGGGRADASGRVARAALQRTSMRVSTSLTQALGSARSSLATSGRMALGNGVANIGRVPGVAAVAGAAGGVVGATAPFAARAAPIAAGLRRAVTDVRGRARAASGAAQRDIASGGGASSALGAAATAATRPRSGSVASDGGVRERARKGGESAHRPSTRPGRDESSSRPSQKSPGGEASRSRRALTSPTPRAPSPASAPVTDEPRATETRRRVSRKRRAQPTPSSSPPSSPSRPLQQPRPSARRTMAAPDPRQTAPTSRPAEPSRRTPSPPARHQVEAPRQPSSHVPRRPVPSPPMPRRSQPTRPAPPTPPPPAPPRATSRSPRTPNRRRKKR